MKFRTAIVTNEIDRDRVVPYLPESFDVQQFMFILANGEVVDRLFIIGSDVAGWTMDEYVIPRLASGLIFAEEVT